MIYLRDIRKSRHMTMKELGQKVGVTEAAIGYYETGKRLINYEMLLKLSEALDCSVADILGNEKMPTVQQDNGHEKEILDFMQTVDQLDQQNLATLKDIALSLLKRQSTQDEQ